MRLVSDLHLGLDTDPRQTTAHFARFLDSVVLPHADATTLVLLGDTFELGCRDGRSTAERLEAIAARHATVIASMVECVRAGARLHFVAGNHDVDLSRPAARARLHQLLAHGGAGSVDVHPWALHVPGVLFAEHGHQHHVVHRLPTMLLVDDDDEVPLDPSMLDAWTSTTAQGAGRVGALTAAARAASRAETASTREPYRRRLDEHAAAVQLDPGAVRHLWDVTHVRPATALPAAALRRLRAGVGLQPSPRAPRAASRVASSLVDHGHPVRWYVTGHTHRAMVAPIPRSDTGYLNTGTWTSDVRGPGPDRSDPGLYPVVTITSRGMGWTADLDYWRASS